MPMPPWQDQPANSNYKRALRDLRPPLPRWWPGRMNVDVVGGDLESGSIVMHLPVENNPYFARVPAVGPTGGNVDITIADLERRRTRHEWIDGEWKYIVFSRDDLSFEDLAHVKLSMRTKSLETSSRAVTFDPTDHELFVAQQQGFDWKLLQNGAVHRYKDRFSLDTATGHLSDLNYLIHSFDAKSWSAVSQMYSAFAASMSFPDDYGQGLDAFNDVLSDVASYQYGSDPNCRGTVLAIADFDSLVNLDRHAAVTLLDVFARQARLAALFGHAMLCLVESADGNLGRAGGLDVHAASVSELPPDPPEPFDESIIVEFVFQFYATDSESRSFAAAVESAAVPVLDEVGRYETRTNLTSERAGQFDEIHSSSGRRRRPGQSLIDINIAVRGQGDRSTLGEDVFHAVSAAKLPFEQMYETVFSGDTLDIAVKHYPSLALL